MYFDAIRRALGCLPPSAAIMSRGDLLFELEKALRCVHRIAWRASDSIDSSNLSVPSASIRSHSSWFTELPEDGLSLKNWTSMAEGSAEPQEIAGAESQLRRRPHPQAGLRPPGLLI